MNEDAYEKCSAALIDALPTEIMLKIFSYISTSIPEMLPLLSTKKTWRTVAQDDTLWERFILSRFPHLSKVEPKIGSAYAQYKHLTSAENACLKQRKKWNWVLEKAGQYFTKERFAALPIITLNTYIDLQNYL